MGAAVDGGARAGVVANLELAGARGQVSQRVADGVGDGVDAAVALAVALALQGEGRVAGDDRLARAALVRGDLDDLAVGERRDGPTAQLAGAGDAIGQ